MNELGRVCQAVFRDIPRKFSAERGSETLSVLPLGGALHTLDFHPSLSGWILIHPPPHIAHQETEPAALKVVSNCQDLDPGTSDPKPAPFYSSHAAFRPDALQPHPHTWSKQVRG